LLVPVTVTLPLTGTGFAVVLTTVTGADGGTCGAPLATIGNNNVAAPDIAR
jgi:hypothetical protein